MIRLATVFSGIGAIEHALYRMNIHHEIVFACDNGDVDIFSKKIDLNYKSILAGLSDLRAEVKKDEIQIKKTKNKDIVWQYSFLVGQINSLEKSVNSHIKENENNEKNEAKQIKEVSFRVSMLYERLNTINVLLHLDNLRTYDEKKK